MLTSKERSALSALAQKIEPIFQIGKNGVTDVLKKELSDALEARELIKISIQRNAELDAKSVLNELARELNAEPVSCVGFRIVLYRESSRNNIKHIEF